MDRTLSGSGLPNPDDNAPEVVPRESDLIPAPMYSQNDAESLQVAHQYKSAAGMQQNGTQHYTPQTEYSSQNDYYFSQQEKNDLLVGSSAHEELSTLKTPKSARRRRWIWIIAAALIILAIALGVGLGIGLSQASSGSGTNLGDTPTSITSSPTSTATTAPAVTSGSTGIAQFSCDSRSTAQSSSGTDYVEECFTQYTTGQPSFYHDTNNVTTANLGGKLTVYTFTACLDACDQYNAGDPNPPCRGVTYYANLSTPIQLWGGNCFLKNDRGTDLHADPVDWSHTMSAYQSCLNETCSGLN